MTQPFTLPDMPPGWQVASISVGRMKTYVKYATTKRVQVQPRGRGTLSEYSRRYAIKVFFDPWAAMDDSTKDVGWFFTTPGGQEHGPYAGAIAAMVMAELWMAENNWEAA